MAAPTEHRIFHIAEMLETISAELPGIDLLLSKAVCKTWKGVIEGSVKLHKALFLVPDGEMLKPLQYRSEEQPATVDIEENPLLEDLLEALEQGSIIFDLQNKAIVSGVHSGSKIWRSMLLTQPPVSALKVCDRWRTPDGSLLRSFAKQVENADGLRMRDVLEVMEKLNEEAGAPIARNQRRNN